jgi:hypothetical protein
MKAYLITTGALFAVLATAHIARVVGEWPGVLNSLAADAEAGVGLVAAGLAVWAWRLVRSGGGRGVSGH